MICPALELLQKVAELMRRTEQLQGLRLMKFDEVYGRTYRGELSQLEAAEILGMSERTFRRWRDRFEAEGAEGLYDRRLGRVSARRAGVDEVVALLDLFDTRYRHFTAWHFWEKLVAKGVVAGIGVGLIAEHFVTSLDFPDAAQIQRCPAAQV